MAINYKGQVAGFTFNGPWTAFLWQRGQMLDLGTAFDAAFTSISAQALNDRGKIIGNYGNSTYTGAFLWDRGEATDLNSLIPADSGWTVSQANGINDLGQIVGTGIHVTYTTSGQPVSSTHGFLMTPSRRSHDEIGDAGDAESSPR